MKRRIRPVANSRSPVNTERDHGGAKGAATGNDVAYGGGGEFHSGLAQKKGEPGPPGFSLAEYLQPRFGRFKVLDKSL